MYNVRKLKINQTEKQDCTPKEAVTIVDILHTGIHASYAQYLIEIGKEN